MLRHMLTWYGLNGSASTYQINDPGLKISSWRCVTEATARWGGGLTTSQRLKVVFMCVTHGPSSLLVYSVK